MYKRQSDDSLYRPAGYGIWDLLAHWRFAPGVRADIGVFNLGDKRYTDWADVPGVAATSATLDRYTRPGRTLAVNPVSYTHLDVYKRQACRCPRSPSARG